MSGENTEIDLDSIIDRLLEGECLSCVHPYLSYDSHEGVELIHLSQGKPPRKGRPAARVRNQVSVHKSARDLYQPTDPP
jgi:hypothetical protein